MRQKKDFDEQFDSWEELLRALEYDYTTSFKDVCWLLKASRDWVNKYIRPFVKSVYIRNNKRGDGRVGVDWVRMAAIKLERDMTDSIWFHTEELMNYIKGSVVSVTKQTKSVPIDYFMEPDDADEYFENLESIKDELKEATAPMEIMSLVMKRDNLYKQYIRENAATNQIMKSRLSVTKRKEAPAVPVKDDIPITEWIAPHDIKKYGDADETIYRNFFRHGYIRVELQMVDVDGCVGKKVYYAADPKPIEGYKGERFIFPEESWQKYIAGAR